MRPELQAARAIADKRIQPMMQPDPVPFLGDIYPDITPDPDSWPVMFRYVEPYTRLARVIRDPGPYTRKTLYEVRLHAAEDNQP